MILKKGQLAILIVNLISIISFGIFYLSKRNYEFVLYVAIIIFLFGLILMTNKKSNLSNFTLWGLTIWAFFHMAGGSFTYNGAIWYKQILIDLVNNSNFIILRYDQAIHAFGFFVATLVGYEMLKPSLDKKANWTILSFLLVLIGMGFGVINELLEFFAVVIMPETGVGGYNNTLLDLTFNTIGAIGAVILLNIRKR